MNETLQDERTVVLNRDAVTLTIANRFAVLIGMLVVCGMLCVAGCSRTSPVDEVAVDDSAPFEELPEPTVGPNDWPWWRGPNRDGIAAGDPVPLHWSETENVLWKTAVPGRGHSSPIIVGERLFLATADEQNQIQSVLCFARDSGQQQWKTDIHTGYFPSSGVHPENSHASCTVACDGERVFTAFFNDNKIWVTALDLNGIQIWQQDVGRFRPQFGYAPSPVIYQSLVIVAADHHGGGTLVALHRKTGKVRWRKARPPAATYSSPVVAHVAGKDQLLITGAEQVISYNPQTGDELWSCDGTAEGTCGTMVFEDDLVFGSGGYPQSDTLCVRADGSAEILWRKNQKAYVPSMLVNNGFLYAVDGEGGIAYCWESKTGKEIWKKRLSPKLRASPLLAGGHLYISNVHGKTYVVKANQKRFELVAENQLGDEIYASPVALGGRLYLRTANSSSGTRRETLYCISD